MSFWSDWFKSDEEKCRELIGVTLANRSDNPFEPDMVTIKITDVKNGYAQFLLNNELYSTLCGTLMNIIEGRPLGTPYKPIGGIKDPNVFVKGESADDWGH